MSKHLLTLERKNWEKLQQNQTHCGMCPESISEEGSFDWIIHI